MRTLLVLLLLTSPALGAELTATGDGGVREVDCTYDVTLDGLVAKVTTRQELRATGAGPVEATYRFALPAQGAIVGLAITPPGGKAQRAAAVDATAAITPAADHDTLAIAPDLGLLRWIGGGDGEDDVYELVVYPVEADASTIVEISWVAPMTYVDGRLSLRVPPRGGALGAISGTVRAAPPPGVKKLRDLHAGGALVAAKPGEDAWPFLADGELTFDVSPVLTRAVVSFATAKVDDHGGAVAVSLLRPRADDALSRFARALFVLDVSASNASVPAQGAMAALVDGVIGGLRSDAQVQALLFDRAVDKAFTGFVTPSADERAALKERILGASGDAGTDLTRALTEAHGLVEGLDGATLVVIVTDGVLPSDADLAQLDGALDLAVDVTVSAVLLAPDDRATPDPRGGVLDELTARHDGHVVATRHGEAAVRAGTIAGELGAGGDWFLDGSGVDVTVPDRVAPGGGFVAFGWYEGAAPDTVTLATSEGDLAAKSVKLPRIAALALAGPGWTGAVRDGASAARTLGVVTGDVSLVAVDRTDDLAAARLDLAARGGTFVRLPAPGEEAFEAPGGERPELLDIGARYEIDTAGRIRADLISPQLLPAARACFDAARTRGAAPSGTVTLEVEIAGGEVIAARARSTAAVELITCLREGAYALTVPSYTLDEPDTIYLIRYPLQFATKGTVAVGDDTGLEPIDLGDAVDQPLGDLTKRE